MLAFGILLSTTTALRADEPKSKDIDRTPKSCIMVQSIARDEAANERTVLFFMKGNKQIYRNDMPQACAFLKRGETELEYHYNTQSVKLTRLCDYDGITVQHANQITCALGKFTPVTAEEASALLGKDVSANEPAKSSGGATNAGKSAEQAKKK